MDIFSPTGKAATLGPQQTTMGGTLNSNGQLVYSAPTSQSVLGSSDIKSSSSTTPSPAATQTGTGTNATNYGSIFQPLYDNQVNAYQSQMNALPNYQATEEAGVNNTFNPQANTLNDQHAQGQANLDLAQQQLNTNQSQGLRNIGNNLRSALNGYQNQIGVLGAGNSSAAPLIGYALSQQGNRQMSDFNTGVAQQQSGIDLQHTALEKNFQDQMDGLNSWKSQQLNNIALKYSQQQQALQNAIANAKGDEARYLAMYGSTALAQQAVSDLQNLESGYNDQVGQLNSHLQSVAAPQTDISKYAGPYTVQTVTPDQLQTQSLTANQASPADTSASASLLRRPDQTPTTSFGF